MAMAIVTNPDIETDIPHEVYVFLRSLNRAVEMAETELLNDLYENQFEKLSASYYGASQGTFRPWPSQTLDQITGCFRNRLAMLLYTFLRFKHLFTDREVKFEDAKLSWETYVEIFDYVKRGEGDLPNWLLWDLFDEFAYQMAVAYQRCFTGNGVWGVAEALRTLDGIIGESSIAKMLQDEPAEVIAKPGPDHITVMGGFFAVITKAKINVLLGDFYGALHGLQCLDVYGRGKQLLLAATPAQISMMYYVGFCYLMLRRYVDAARVFRQCVMTRAYNRVFSERVQADAAYMHVVSAVLGGIGVDNVSSAVDGKRSNTFEDDKELLASGDEDRFREVFERCSPKFIAIPPASGAPYRGTEARELHARLFRRDVQQQEVLLQLRGYFGVYHTTTTSQINSLLDSDSGLAPLFAMKMRTKQLVHDGISANLLSGKLEARGALDCVVNGENVKVVQRSTFRSMDARYVHRISNARRRLKQVLQGSQKEKQPQPQQHSLLGRSGNQARPMRTGEYNNATRMAPPMMTNSDRFDMSQVQRKPA